MYNTDTSLENLLQIHYLIELTKNEIRTKSKSWLTTGILTPIHVRKRIYNKFCKAKDNRRKELLYQRFVTYINLISNLTKKVKKFITNCTFMKTKII